MHRHFATMLLLDITPIEAVQSIRTKSGLKAAFNHEILRYFSLVLFPVVLKSSHLIFNVYYGLYRVETDKIR